MRSGIDLSHWQGDVNWHAVKGDGYEFAIIKATEGTTWIDPVFGENVRAAAAAGLETIAYHYFRNEANPVSQATHFYRTVSNALGYEAKYAIDLEDMSYKLPVLDLRNRVHSFLDMVRVMTGAKPIIYTGAWWWNDWMVIDGQAPTWAKGHPLWVASYNNIQPVLPIGWNDWYIWQYSNEGRVQGIGTKVDLNYMKEEERMSRYMFGPHINYNNAASSVLAWLEQAPVPILKTMDFDRSFLQRTKEMRPDIKIIGRLYDLQQPLGSSVAEASAYGLAFADRIAALDINNTDLVHYWESYNERIGDAAPEHEHRLYAAFQVAFAERLLQHGREPVAMNLGTGNGSDRLLSDYYQGVLDAYTYIGFHEYDFPTMDRLHRVGLSKPDDPSLWFYGGPQQGDGGCWLALRYRRIMNPINLLYGSKHRVFITETGMTQGVWPGGHDIGWLAPKDTTGKGFSVPIMEQNYADTLNWYQRELGKDDYVDGAALFVVGSAADWATFDARPVLHLIENKPEQPPPEGGQKVEQPLIYGIHDTALVGLLEQGGWVTTVNYVGGDPDDLSSVNHEHLEEKGVTVIARLDFAGGQSIPDRPDDYVRFAQRCANFIQHAVGCRLFILGNEPNLRAEGQHDPYNYGHCYLLLLDELEKRNVEGVKVLIAGPGPWNNETKYAGNPDGDWLLYLRHQLEGAGISNVQGVSLHAYTHGHNPNLVTDESTMNPPFDNHRYNFRVYRDFVRVLDEVGWEGDVYLTEANGNDPNWGGGDNGFLEAMYEEVNGWNVDYPSRQIRCCCVFRSLQGDQYGYGMTPAVQQDFKRAYAKGYTWLADKPPPVEPPSEYPKPSLDERPVFHPAWLNSLPTDQTVWPPVLPPKAQHEWGRIEDNEHVGQMWRPCIKDAGGLGIHGDNGRGIHWAPSTSIWTAPIDPQDPSGPTQWETKHLPFLRAAKICWVKALDDGGGSNIEFVLRLLAEGIMPVVRSYRLEPYPDPITAREVEMAAEYAKWGVVYMEFDNEPDLQEEWRVPMPPYPEWLHIVTRRYIDTWDKVRAATKGRVIPLTPAFGPGGRGNMFTLLKEWGRMDILENLVVSGHYYALSRPPAYPNDGKKDLGRHWSSTDYQVMTQGRYADGSWGPALTQEPWRQVWEVSRATANQWIDDHHDPSITINDDATGFRGFEDLAELFRAEVGWYPPIICTEGGYNIGQRAGTTFGDIPDNPKITDRWQAMYTKYCMDDYPVPYFYLTDTYWFMVGYQIGVFAADFEAQGPLFTNIHDTMYNLGGEISLTGLLRDNPGRVRHPGNLPPFWSHWQDPDHYEGRSIAPEFKMADPDWIIGPVPFAGSGLRWKAQRMRWQSGAGYVFFRCLDEDGQPIEGIPVTMTAFGNTWTANTKGQAAGGWGDMHFGGHPAGNFTLWVDDGQQSEQVHNLGNFHPSHRGYKTSDIYIEFVLVDEEERPMSWEWAYDFDRKALENEGANGAPLNEAMGYGVTLSNPNVPQGQQYWKIIGVRHLTPAENAGNHAAYVGVYDEDGNIVAGRPGAMGWTWEGRRPEEPAPPFELKAEPERGNVTMHFQQTISQWCLLDSLVSGVVSGIHTRHPDEAPGNTLGHHSFYTVFKLVTSGGGTPPVEPTPPQASISAPSSAKVAVPVYCSGANSQAGSSDIVSYRWDFGDGSTGEGMEVSKAYAVAGTYTITLTVTDVNELNSQTQQQILIEQGTPPPTGDQYNISGTVTLTPVS